MDEGRPPAPPTADTLPAPIEDDDVLVISDRPVRAGGGYVPWSALPAGLPTITQYRTLLVVPAGGTADAQERLVQLLQNDLKLVGSGSTRIVWFLNEHGHAAALEKIGLGRPIPVRGARRGHVHSFVHRLSFDLDAVHFAFADVPAHATPLAVWDTVGAAGSVVGVASASGRWALIPPPRETMDAVLSGRLPVLSRAVAYVVLVALFLAAAFGLRGMVADARRTYRASVAELGAIDGLGGLRLPDARAELRTRWLGAEERVASALMGQDRERLVEFADRLDPTRSPYDLYADGDDPYTESFWFHLAFLTGDVGAARRMLADEAATAGADEWYEGGLWMNDITRVFWEVALGSLNELDFPRASTYTRIYLEDAAALTHGVTFMYDLGPERTRTLARMLGRELATDRIYSLCDAPDVRNTFGRLTSLGLADTLPAEGLAELEQRREANRARYCGADRSGERVDYARALATLGEMRELGEPDPEDVAHACGVFPLECRFTGIRNRILRNQPAVEDEVAEFARSCTYLTDDLLGVLFYERQGQGRDEELTNDPRLGAAWACALAESSDFRGVLLHALTEPRGRTGEAPGGDGP